MKIKLRLKALNSLHDSNTNSETWVNIDVINFDKFDMTEKSVVQNSFFV